jgi:hypothetical protein
MLFKSSHKKIELQVITNSCKKFLILSIPLQVIDLARVSQEVAYLSSDADLVILEGMVRPFNRVKLVNYVLSSLRYQQTDSLTVLYRAVE